MKKFLPLLLCLLFSIFTVARATKPAHTAAPDTRTAQNEPTPEEGDAEVGSDDDDSMEGASGDEDEDVNDDDGGGAPGDENTGDDDAGDDNGGDDGGGAEGE
jgi:hypothetical protein